MCTSPSILKRHVAIARLKNPCNLGRNCQEARFIVFILSPMREKGTKNFRRIYNASTVDDINRTN